MSTHAHYVSELNYVFGNDWIINDKSLGYHLLCMKYKVKSAYNNNIININILYNNIINTKNTLSCNIIINNNVLLIITKPTFDNSDVITYKITATKIDKYIEYIMYNSIKIAHPKYLFLSENNYEIIIKKIEKYNIKNIKQIEYLKKQNIINTELIKYLENDIINYIDEPVKKKQKCE